jgi:hypothetical protein
MTGGEISRRIGAFAVVMAVVTMLCAAPAEAQSYERARLSWTPPDVTLSLIVLDGTTESANRADLDNPGGIPGAALSRDANGELVFTESQATARTFQYVVCNTDTPRRDELYGMITDARTADIALRVTGPPDSGDSRTLRHSNLFAESGVALGSSPPGQARWVVANACDLSPPPVLGSSAVATPYGNVTVRSGNGVSEPLPATGPIPVGSEVDASRGNVRLTGSFSVDGTKTRSGFFSGASFTLQQASTSGAPLVLRLDKPPAPCSKRNRRRPLTFSAESQRGFRVFGGRSVSEAATPSVSAVSEWETIERCTGTETRVRVGRVSVYDRNLRRTVKLGRGQRYLARRGNR